MRKLIEALLTKANPTAVAMALIMLAAIIVQVLQGCASLAPGADPLAVRAEQAEQGATATFNLVVTVDDANRQFWRTNAPAFHEFAEWLRAPVTIDGTNLPEGLALIRSLDDVKNQYEAGQASSNALITVLTTLQAATTQAEAWSIIISNTAH